MKAEIKYERDDITALVMKAHTERFGAAPAGEHWECSENGYGSYIVENVEDPKPVPTEAAKVANE